MNDDYDNDAAEHSDDKAEFTGYEWISTAADPNMSVLDQIKVYQHMARRVYPYLDVYEIAVLGQIVDRITGWKKDAAKFSAQKLYVGDTMYGGLARAMDWAKMMETLRSLENRNVIARLKQRDSRIRIYWVNPEPDLDLLRATAPPLRKSGQRIKLQLEGIVANGDNVVANADGSVASSDFDVAEGDTREGYRENGIINCNLENTTHPEPSAPGARSLSDFSEAAERPAQARGVARPEIRPRTRRRAPS